MVQVSWQIVAVALSIYSTALFGVLYWLAERDNRQWEEIRTNSTAVTRLRTKIFGHPDDDSPDPLTQQDERIDEVSDDQDSLRDQVDDLQNFSERHAAEVNQSLSKIGEAVDADIDPPEVPEFNDE